jgi:renalase
VYSKPGRDANKECWVVHGSPDWSKEHFNDTPEAVTQKLKTAFVELTGVKELPKVETIHRWVMREFFGKVTVSGVFLCSQQFGG